VGCADRSCFDLTQHTKTSGTKLVASRRLPQPVFFDVEFSKTVCALSIMCNRHLFTLMHEALIRQLHCY